MILEIKELACGYLPAEPVLHSISFSIQTGEMCCLLGANGAGKTTLFKSILGLLKPLNGEVLLDGQKLSKIPPKARSKYLAYVSQSHSPPFPYKVCDVVMMGRISQIGYFSQPTENDRRICMDILEKIGLAPLYNKDYTEISGGERQLVMLARALAQEPSFLVLDEPTANLDFGNMVKVLRHLISLKENELGILMTTHSPEQAFLCEAKTAVITQERTLQFGEASDVLTAQNLSELYNTKMRIIEYYDDQNSVLKTCVPVL